MKRPILKAFPAAISAVFFLLSGCSIQPPERVEPGQPTPSAEPLRPIAFEERAAGPDRYTRLMHEYMKGQPLPQPAFKLADPGSPDPVDYAAYGKFTGVGTDQYEYEIDDLEGLKKAVGEGIFPNNDAVLSNPAYDRLMQADAIPTLHWNALTITNLEAAFFAWAQAPEEAGVQAFYTATILEKANAIFQAIKAYHAVLVHFPRSACWAEDKSYVWYVAPTSLASIQRLCSEYPGLGLWLEDASWTIENGQDTDLSNDLVTVHPGRIVKVPIEERIRNLPDLATLEVKERRGKGKVQLVRYSNDHWRMLVDGEPFVVRGATYTPTEVGCTPEADKDYAYRWAFTDKDGNGKADAPYDAWVDRNGNGAQDADEPSVGDFQLMKDMGVNAIRYYIPVTRDAKYDPSQVNKELFRDLYERHGIRVIAGDFLGAYTVGSGAHWELGTDYKDPRQLEFMREVVRQKVLDLRGEPWLLMWLLGNENNMKPTWTGVNATRTNAGSEPEAWAEFLNEIAEMIHELDPDHPVAVGNLDLGLADVYGRLAPAVDVFGINAYRGPNGFGNLWAEAHAQFNRPVMITEYGCDAYFEGEGPDEQGQADYHAGCLRDIVLNQAGGYLQGNSIGGVIFEFVDEWWKAPGDSPWGHATHAQGGYPFPDNHGHEEWFGIVGQGTGTNSPFERNLRKAYHFYRRMWAGEPIAD